MFGDYLIKLNFCLLSFLVTCVLALVNQTESDGHLLDLNETHSLESFIHRAGNNDPNPRIKALRLALRIDLLANSSAADNQDYYHMATSRLKKLLPNLEQIELHGGHCFYPLNGDTNQFKNELNFLSYSIESIWKAFRYVDVVVKPLSYKMALVFNKQVIDSTNVEEVLRKLFGQESAIHSSGNKTHFTVMNDAHKNHLDIRLDFVTDLSVIQERTNLQFGRSNFSAAMKEFYKVPGSGFYEQIFIPGKKLVYRTIYNPLYLDELAEKVNIKVQNELEKLTLNLLIFPFANETLDGLDEKYGKAVENLDRAAPKLQHIDIIGGHSFLLQNGTPSDVENELKLLKNGLNAIPVAFAAHNLTLHSVIMQVFLVFPEETFTSMNYSDRVFETFGNNPNVNITSLPNLTIVDQRLERSVEIRLELSTTSDFKTVQSMTQLSEGYSEDFTAASLFSSLDMSFIRGDLHLHDW